MTTKPEELSQMKKLLTLLAALALASFALAACGSDDSALTRRPPPRARLRLTPRPPGEARRRSTSPPTPTASLAFTETKIDAKAGAATLELVNDSPTTHDLVVEDGDGNDIGKTDAISGGTTSFDADLKPGTYTYYCSLPGHREAGMEGTLTVK